MNCKNLKQINYYNKMKIEDIYNNIVLPFFQINEKRILEYGKEINIHFSNNYPVHMRSNERIFIQIQFVGINEHYTGVCGKSYLYIELNIKSGIIRIIEGIALDFFTDKIFDINTIEVEEIENELNNFINNRLNG